jgi:hypothetical protein
MLDQRRGVRFAIGFVTGALLGAMVSLLFDGITLVLNRMVGFPFKPGGFGGAACLAVLMGLSLGAALMSGLYGD